VPRVSAKTNAEQSDAAVDVVLRADWVLTVDASDTVIVDGAVLVGEGRILGVGPAEAVLAANPSAPVRHLRGHALLPGLVNAHTHLAMTMFRGVADDLSLEAFLARLLPTEGEVLSAERVRTATLAAAVESLCAGTTTALDMYYFVDEALDAARSVGMGLAAGPVFLDAAASAAEPIERWIEHAGHWLEQHPAGPGWRPVLNPHATYTVTPHHLGQIAELAAHHGAVVHIHASETEAEVESVLGAHGRRPVEHLEELGLLRPLTVLAHAVHLTDAEIERIASTGTAVAHCPASNLKLASGIARVPDLLSAGATVGLGTDGPASSNDLDLFSAMRLAALVHKAVAADPTTLPASQVLRMATVHGARALGLEAEIGSIEAGKRADLVAVDLDRAHTQPVYDPASTLVYAAGRGDVRHVWTGGRQVVEDGVPTLVDPAAVTAGLAALRSVVRAAL
jgi:5-methylthioadenosine/S-adenosylhomocysteine deaminase